MKKYIAPFLISLTFLITGMFTISDYGINWDSQCRMMRGQAFTELFLTGQKSYSNSDIYRTPPNLIKPDEYVTRFDFVSCESFKQASLSSNPLPKTEYQRVVGSSRISFYQHPFWDGNLFINGGDGKGHPPLPEILGSFSNRLFWGVIGLFGDIESYSLIYLLISAIGVFIVSAFALEITGSVLAGIITGLCLGLFPLFFAESHFNLKDPLQASLYAGAVWSFWHWVKEENFKFQISNFQFPIWWGVMTIFTTLALAIKWNIAFLPVILGIWFLFIRKSEEFKAWFKLRKLLPLFLLSLITCFLFLILIWPASWANPLEWFRDVLIYYLTIGTGFEPGQLEGFKLPLGFNGYPLALFFTQTPEIILILGLFGIIGLFKGKKQSTKPELLILLWLIIPLLRYSLPFTRNYGGLKQVMEILPAATILAGIGFHFVNQILKSKYQKYCYYLICIFAFLYLIFNIASFHPNQNVYFNNLVGGVKGAEKANLIDLMITNGNVYKQGVDWLNNNAEKDAKLAITDGRMIAISPLWLRDDISISPNNFSGLNKKGEYLLMSITSQKRDFFAYHYPQNFLNPVHTIDVDGVPILYIFKNDIEHTKSGYQTEENLTDYKVTRISKNTLSYYEISLPKIVKVSRLVVTNYRKKCPDKDFYSFTDELITFPRSDRVYALNERKIVAENQIEYSFPAEEADRIYIYPQSDNSCFIGGKILSISALK